MVKARFAAGFTARFTAGFGSSRRYPPLIFSVLGLLLTACPGDNGPSGAPSIDSFSANPATVAAGQPVTLTWSVSGNPTGLSIDNGVGAVSGTTRSVTPTATTTYTLTATNSGGQSDTETTTVNVTGGPVTPPPSGTFPDFAVSAAEAGPFTNDAGTNILSAADDRVVNVAAGGTFYARVSYSDPEGISNIVVYLANRSPAGFTADLAQGQNVRGFTLGAPLAGCDLSSSPTSVTCIYPVTVAPGTPNITGLTGAGTEFAYVLRTRVTDGAGTEVNEPPRGYVTVGDVGTPAPPVPTPTPVPPTGFTLSVSKTGSGSGTVTSSPGSISCGSDCSETYEADTDVTLTAAAASGSVFTGWGGACSGTGSCEVTMDAATSVTATFTLSSTPPPTDEFGVSVAEVAPVTLSGGSATASLNGTAVNVPDTGTTTYVWAAEGGNSGNVTFATPSAVDTSATFSAAGTYTVRLTATNTLELPDDVTEVSDAVQVVVNAAGGGDTVRPTVTLNQAAGQDDPASGSPIIFTVTFSESVTGFNRNDLELSGAGAAGTGRSNVNVFGNGAAYRVEVSGLSAAGPVAAAVSSNAAADAAGNRSDRSTSADATVTYQPQP